MTDKLCYTCGKFSKIYYKCTLCETAIYCSIQCKNKDSENHYLKCFDYQFQQMISNVTPNVQLQDCSKVKQRSLVKQLDRLGVKLFNIFETIKDIVINPIVEDIEVEVRRHDVIGLKNTKRLFIETEKLYSAVSYFILTCNSMNDIMRKASRDKTLIYIKIFMKKITAYLNMFLKRELKDFAYFIVEQKNQEIREIDPFIITVSTQTIKVDEFKSKISCVIRGNDDRVLMHRVPEYYNIITDMIGIRLKEYL